MNLQPVLVNTRVLSGFVLAVICAGVASIGFYGFVVFLMLATLIAVYEWREMVVGIDSNETELDKMLLVLVALPFVALFRDFWELFWILVLSAGILYAFFDAYRNLDIRWSVPGFGYVVVAAGLFLEMLSQQGYWLICWMILSVVAMDIGAYYSGRYFKGPTLWSRISPKKTWAGVCGGAISALLVGLTYGWITGHAFVLLLGLLSFGIALVSQAGDLAMSAVKRHFEKKDFGALIPGHGGVLDRIDGHLAAVYATWALIVSEPKLLNF